MESEWTIVTVTHNSAGQLRERWQGRDFSGVRWVVVDNASRDDSVTVARALGADVIELPRNVGFARANNRGLGASTTEWVAFVNPDVEVVFDSLDGLARLARRHGALVAPQLTNADGSFQPNGRGFPFLVDKLSNRGIALPGARLSRYTPDTSPGPTYVAWSIGAAIGGLRSTFDALGGWDERYFLYYEDHDLGLRAWRAGHRVIVDPGARWIHDWQRETSRFVFAAWRREIASAVRFFTTYPEFLVPSRRGARRRHTNAGHLVGLVADSA